MVFPLFLVESGIAFHNLTTSREKEFNKIFSLEVWMCSCQHFSQKSTSKMFLSKSFSVLFCLQLSFQATSKLFAPNVKTDERKVNCCLLRMFPESTLFHFRSPQTGIIKRERRVEAIFWRKPGVRGEFTMIGMAKFCVAIDGSPRVKISLWPFYWLTLAPTKTNWANYDY